MLSSPSLLSKAVNSGLYTFKLNLNKLKGFQSKNTEEVLHGRRERTPKTLRHLEDRPPPRGKTELPKNLLLATG